MKIYKLFFSLLIFASMPATLLAQNDKTIFELKPNQSMLMTGKGPGQDGAINPYADSDSYAIVTNLGDNPFSVRVQWKNEVIQLIQVNPNEEKTVTLYRGYRLFFDTEAEAKAQLVFKKKES